MRMFVSKTVKLYVFYAKSFAYKYSGVIKVIGEIVHEKGVSFETSPLIGDRGLYKRKKTQA